MADNNPNVVSVVSTAPKLPDGVIGLDDLQSSDPVAGCRVFTHYNGPTDQLSGLCAGMCVLEPGSTLTEFGHDAAKMAQAEKLVRPEDVASVLVAALKLPARATVSEIEIRPTDPPV